MKECSFCRAYEMQRLIQSRNTDTDFSYKNRAALLTYTSYKGGEPGRNVNYISNGKGCPLNYCPECGKKLI